MSDNDQLLEKNPELSSRTGRGLNDPPFALPLPERPPGDVDGGIRLPTLADKIEVTTAFFGCGLDLKKMKRYPLVQELQITSFQINHWANQMEDLMRFYIASGPEACKIHTRLPPRVVRNRQMSSTRAAGFSLPNEVEQTEDGLLAHPVRFVCPVCGPHKSYTTTSACSRHIRQFHGDHIAKQFLASAGEERVEMFIRTGRTETTTRGSVMGRELTEQERGFECPVCPRRFAQVESFERHKASVHGMLDMFNQDGRPRKHLLFLVKEYHELQGTVPDHKTLALLDQGGARPSTAGPMPIQDIPASENRPQQTDGEGAITDVEGKKRKKTLPQMRKKKRHGAENTNSQQFMPMGSEMFPSLQSLLPPQARSRARYWVSVPPTLLPTAVNVEPAGLGASFTTPLVLILQPGHACTIGRAATGCDYRIVETVGEEGEGMEVSLSRKHCLLKVSPEGVRVFISDLNSANGTYMISGQQTLAISEEPMTVPPSTDGIRLKVGNVFLSVLVTPPSPANVIGGAFAAAQEMGIPPMSQGGMHPHPMYPGYMPHLDPLQGMHQQQHPSEMQDIPIGVSLDHMQPPEHQTH